MAHTKATGKTNQKATRPGKRLGIKVFGGMKIKTGMIIARQRGTKFLPKIGTKMGKDFTIFAMRNGVVEFSKINKKTYISVR